jgi:hypothetical protein
VVALFKAPKEYISKHNEEMKAKDEELNKMKGLLEEFNHQRDFVDKGGGWGLDVIQQCQEHNREQEAEINNMKLYYEDVIVKMKNDHNEEVKKLEQQIKESKKVIARSISNQRPSIASSNGSSSKRHSSVKSLRHKSTRNNRENSFTMQSRYPMKKTGIGEFSPPKYDLDQYPTRDKKMDKSIRNIRTGKINQAQSKFYFQLHFL